MRHYIPKSNNADRMPHNLYMQMLYLIRDYHDEHAAAPTAGRTVQRQAVRRTAQLLQEEYRRRPDVYGVLNPLRAFFDYPYFSVMFAQKGRELGASKRLWNLYRCRFARLTAETLGLL